jgi:large subunit ribosomal protein L23
MNHRLYQLLLRPIVTEKTTMLAEKHGQYTFEVLQGANKIELSQAFELAFPGRKVQSVRVVRVPYRTKRYGKRTGTIPERRKAIFQAMGEPPEFFTGV